MQRVEDIGHRATAQYQPLAQATQLGVELAEALGDERPLSQRGVRQTPVVLLDDVQRQHGPAPRRLHQRAVVVCAQVALVPDDLDH